MFLIYEKDDLFQIEKQKIRSSFMVKKCVMLLMTVMVPLLLMGGTTGKIAGTVTDKQSGEPLVGVNIVIEGTTLGSATDADGYYAILNVPVGSHSVRISYIGYRDYVEQGIQVNLDLTATVNFQLERTTIDLGGSDCDRRE
jgi:hypothetical protein